jgi:hypothetical protein
MENELKTVELGTCVVAGCVDRELKEGASSFVICFRRT